MNVRSGLNCVRSNKKHIILLYINQDKIIIFAQNHSAMIMCKNYDFITEITDYIRSVLDENVTLSPLEKRLSDAIHIAIT